jgi:hypothetical protein
MNENELATSSDIAEIKSMLGLLKDSIDEQFAQQKEYVLEAVKGLDEKVEHIATEMNEMRSEMNTRLIALNTSVQELKVERNEMKKEIDMNTELLVSSFGKRAA